LDTVFLDDAAKKREKSSFSIGKDGKIQSEQVKDKDDKPVGEFVNTWDGDRLASITWTPDTSDSASAKDKEKTVKYEYDKDGNRTRELDYMGDQLEREVLFDGDKQTEKLYVNGVLMLTTVTENGKKVSEIRPQKPLY
jgi:YD repeat-containing protein